MMPGACVLPKIRFVAEGSDVVAADVDLLVLAELNPDVLVSTGDLDVRFGQVEQLVDQATITLGSSGAITACAAAAQGLRVAVCAVIGDDPIGEWTAGQLRGHGVDVGGVIRRTGRSTGMSVVLTRPDGDRAILTYSGTMPELTAADVDGARLRAARHVHASSFFLQRGLQAGLPGLLAAAREAGATTSLDTGWAPAGDWACPGPALRHLHYLLPNAAECAHLAAALVGKVQERPADQDSPTQAAPSARRRRCAGSAQMSSSSWARTARWPSPPTAPSGSRAAPSRQSTPQGPVTASMPGSSPPSSTEPPQRMRCAAQSPAARSPSPAGAARAGSRPAQRRWPDLPTRPNNSRLGSTNISTRQGWDLT